MEVANGPEELGHAVPLHVLFNTLLGEPEEARLLINVRILFLIESS